jgi:MinD-like ATPase involved in chromosome partitioning or flagellar assembly
LSKEGFDFIPLSSKMVIIINNDILSLTDSFALMKALTTLKNIKDFDIITNKMTQSESITAFMRLQKTSALFLNNSRLDLISNIPFNKDFITSLNNQQPLSKSDSSINNIFRSVLHKLSDLNQNSTDRNIYG